MSEVEYYVLDLIFQGKLRLSKSGVERLHNNKWLIKKTVPNTTGRDCYVFKFQGKCRRVFANRLVWMLYKKKGIPEGCVVDHKDLNKHNNKPSNLQLMSKTESDKQGNSIQLQKHLDKCIRFFEFIATNGREPKTAEEINLVEEGF